MATDPTKVLVGAPDQLVTGAIACGPLTATAPTSAVDSAIAASFPEDTGFVSEDGVELTPENTTADLRDWSGSIVRRVLEEFDGTLSWAHMQTDQATLENYFGEDNVEVTAANTEHGNQIKATLGAYDLPRKSWVFRMKDGANRMLIYVPIGQITSRESLMFQRSSTPGWGVTLTSYPDADGHNVYFFTDDGQVTVA